MDLNAAIKGLYKGTSLHRYQVAADAFPPDFPLMLDVGAYSRVVEDPTGKRTKDLGVLLEKWGVTPFYRDGCPSKGPSQGSRKRLSLNYLADDYEPKRLPDVNADCRHMPFDNASFPLVTAVDLMEHIPPEGRKEALREIVRVAGERAVLVFPYHSQRALDHELSVIEEIREAGVEPPDAFVEHVRYGLPQTEMFDAALREMGVQFAKSYHGLMPIHERFSGLQSHFPKTDLWRQKEIGQIHELILDLSYLTSMLLHDTDYLATPGNSRRVRYVVFPGGEQADMPSTEPPAGALQKSPEDYIGASGSLISGNNMSLLVNLFGQIMEARKTAAGSN